MALFGPYSAEKNAITAQIKDANDRISTERFNIGEKLIEKLDNGMEISDPDLLQIYENVKNQRARIQNLNSQYQEIEDRIVKEQQEREAEAQRKREEAQRLKEAKAAEQSAVRQRAVRALTCPACGNSVIEGAKFCNKCGQKLEEQQAQAYCAVCGAKILPGAKFCNNCGAKIG